MLDISNNKLDDVDIIAVLEALPELKVLYLKGNPVVRKIPSYRKELISRLHHLKHLDDRPVFENERLLARAWKEGGPEAERIEKQRQLQERKDKELRRLQSFQNFISANRADNSIGSSVDRDEEEQRLLAEMNDNEGISQEHVQVFLTEQAHEEHQTDAPERTSIHALD